MRLELRYLLRRMDCTLEFITVADYWATNADLDPWKWNGMFVYKGNCCFVDTIQGEMDRDECFEILNLNIHGQPHGANNSERNTGKKIDGTDSEDVEVANKQDSDYEPVIKRRYSRKPKEINICWLQECLGKHLDLDCKLLNRILISPLMPVRRSARLRKRQNMQQSPEDSVEEIPQSPRRSVPDDQQSPVRSMLANQQSPCPSVLANQQSPLHSVPANQQSPLHSIPANQQSPHRLVPENQQSLQSVQSDGEGHQQSPRTTDNNKETPDDKENSAKGSLNIKTHGLKVNPQKKTRSFKCENCDENFKLIKNLNEHSKTVHPDKPFACKECRKTYSSTNARDRHFKVHTGFNLKCSECGYIAQHPYEMRDHLKKHSNAGMWICPVRDCGLKFTTKRGMVQHEKVHTPDKYVCTHCQKRFQHSRLFTSTCYRPA